jgi:trimeric autotransporter adhesin
VLHFSDGGSIAIDNSINSRDWRANALGQGAVLRKNMVEQILFADGTVWTVSDLKQRALISSNADDQIFGFETNDVINGMAGSDILSGMGGNDSIFGGDGDDLIAGDVGDDLLDGGQGDDYFNGGEGHDVMLGAAGNDWLLDEEGNDIFVGGQGNDSLRDDSTSSNDVYKYALGDGQDVIADFGGFDRIELGSGINASNVSVSYNRSQDVSGFVLTFTDGGKLSILYSIDQADGKVVAARMIEQINFQDGTLWTTATLETLINLPPPNIAPVAAVPLAPVRVTGNVSFTYQVPTGSFVDTDSGNTFVYSISLVSGVGPLNWLSFDSLTGTFRGSPSNAHAGEYSIAVKATDQGGLSATSVMLLSVANRVVGTALANTLNGTEKRDVIEGLAGNDTLDGKQGADTLIGGAGNDTYIVDNVGDVVVELASEGTDLIKASVNFELGENVENLTFTGLISLIGKGNELANVLQANAAGNTLFGFGGNDKLIGGSGADTLNGGDGADTLDGGLGVDRLIGGNGSDTYIVDNEGDQIQEFGELDIDLVKSSINYTLGANLENLTLIGEVALVGIGNELNNTIVANAANNSLFGLLGNDKLMGSAGADLLDGGDGNDTLDGGVGADRMIGGLGNDTFVVDDVSDVVIELSNEGVDTVQSSVNFELASNVENITLVGTAVIGRGNDGSNTLFGNATSNTLYGLEGNDKLDGKAGVDTLVGGIGDDAYTIDETADVVIELASEGTDTVSAYANYVLPAHVEHLTLLGVGLVGTGNVEANTLSGKAGSNDTLYGMAGNDTLRGNGGADILVGGTGDDTYFLTSAGDGAQVMIVEGLSEGIDYVMTTEDYSLAANLENATLASNATGSRLNGNAIDNVLTGNAAANLLFGAAGDDTLNGMAGADSLYGGAGNDIYIIDNVGDAIGEDANNGFDTVRSSVTYRLQNHVENIVLTGTGTTNGFGNDLGNAISGNTKNNVLFGYAGDDMIDAGEGNDTMDAGEGADTILGGDGVDLIAGGAGNDQITSGAGIDVLMFNRGHGTDTLFGSGVKEDVISLAGVRYADLSLSRSGSHLTLSTGGAAASNDVIVLNDWYNGQASIAKLQMIIENGDYNSTGSKIVNRKIEQFDFTKLVTAYETAVATNANLTSWQVTTAALTTAHLTGSDTTALGGAPSLDYARGGMFSTSVPSVTTPAALHAETTAGRVFGGL